MPLLLILPEPELIPRNGQLVIFGLGLLGIVFGLIGILIGISYFHKRLKRMDRKNKRLARIALENSCPCCKRKEKTTPAWRHEETNMSL